MNRDDIVSHQSSYFAEAELTGLDEIRVALRGVEELRQREVDARIEILESDDKAVSCIQLRSFRELQDFITQRYSRLLVNVVDSAIPLDDFERLVAETRIRLLDDAKRIRGHMKIG